MIRNPTIAGANAERSRGYNRRLVLGLIQQRGQLGRAQMARTTGLSTQAVSNIIADLESDGLIYESGRIAAKRGLPAIQYSIVASGAYCLGLEVRPDAVVAALVGLDGEAIETCRHQIDQAGPDVVINVVREIFARLKKEHPVALSRLQGAGVVMPGPFGKTGLGCRESELPGWDEVDARKLFAEVLQCPVVVDKDANAAAMAERISGNAQGLHSFAYLYFGQGVGLGVVNCGQCIAGAYGNAGEIAYLPVKTEQGVMPLEAVASRVSLRKLLEGESLSARRLEQLETLCAQGEPLIEQWCEAAGGALSQALLIVENLYDPQTIILGGALPSNLFKKLIDNIQLSEVSLSARPDRKVPRVQIGKCGSDIAALGAAALSLSQSMTAFPQTTG